MKKIIVLVSSNLVTDQRVLKECATLYQLSFEVEVHCRSLKKSLPLPKVPYSIKPIKLVAEKGIWMYLHLNLTLFFRLLFGKGDIIWANDLDTLLPAFVVSRLRNKKLVYDSHEYYTFNPSLINRPFKRRIWQLVEKLCVPRISHMLTVNQAIKNEYEKKYGVKPFILRNVPELELTKKIGKANLDLIGKKILILQGAGINHDRGGEEVVNAMKFLDDGYYLIIAGTGNALPSLQKVVERLNLTNKVYFTGLMPYNQLLSFTKAAHLGVIPEKINLSAASLYTLPNKLFDYLHAGIPVLSTRAIEVEKIILKYNVGTFIDELTPEHIASTIKSIFHEEVQLKLWTFNTLLAANELCWEKEKNILIKLMQNVITTSKE